LPRRCGRPRRIEPDRTRRHVEGHRLLQ
jgi:hypothetical protein